MSFISNAIKFQKNAETIQQAKKSLEISCSMCCERGLLNCDCDFCPIQHAHNLKIETIKIIEQLNSERGELNGHKRSL